MLAKTGVPTPAQVEAVLPGADRRSQGPVAICECFQEIPCNPCAEACPRGAITVAQINARPHLDEALCNGCGLCVSHCPGLAIVIADYEYGEETALLKLPYEFSPLPEAGELLAGCDRSGEAVAEVKVARVQKNANKTHLLWLEVPKAWIDEVRHVRRKEEAK